MARVTMLHLAGLIFIAIAIAEAVQQPTPLMLAAAVGNLQGVQTLIVEGADVHTTDDHGGTALHAAVVGQHTRVVRTLLTAGAQTEVLGHTGRAPLHYAAYNGDHETITALLDGGAKINVRDGKGSTMPLMFAAGGGHAAAVKVLIARGAKINLKDKQGRAAKDYASGLRGIDDKAMARVLHLLANMKRKAEL